METGKILGIIDQFFLVQQPESALAIAFHGQIYNVLSSPRYTCESAKLR
jgi:hypothetical protein